MMTIKVAAHLNKLRARTLSNVEGSMEVPYDDNEAAGELLNAALACVQAGTDAHIRACATEKRKCQTSNALDMTYASRYYHWQYVLTDRKRNGLTVAIIQAAMPAIVAIYARWNADYEQYRVACEQGVAVAP